MMSEHSNHEAEAIDRYVGGRALDRFAELALGRDEALLDGDIARVNRHFDALTAVEDELKSRPNDQRAALLRLHSHSNMQVRLDAAKSTLAVAPAAARKAIEEIAALRECPQAGDAGMCLRALNEGIIKPT